MFMMICWVALLYKSPRTRLTVYRRFQICFFIKDLTGLS